MSAFRTFDLSAPGMVFEEGALRVHSLGGGTLALAEHATYWLLVTVGNCEVQLGEDRFTLRRDCYLVTPGPGLLAGGRGMVIEQADYRGVRQFGGPLEPRGRLRYVDGCTDTLLVCPARLGEPCLNHLHIPAHTHQSEHTHPSLRLGVIARGAGVCRTPAGDTALREGLGWVIAPDHVHCFITNEGPLDVFAWHPDSDFGPTDRDHPMWNRTILQ